MFLAAAVQLTSTSDEEANWQSARTLIERAAGHGARFVATPENTNYLGPHAEKVRRAEPLDGRTGERFSALARRLGIHLLLGSFNERSDEAERCYNTSVFYGPDGSVLATYRKIHLFDVDVPGAVHRESATITPGAEVVVADAGPLRRGRATCYDLRFPELFRAHLDRGANAVTLPSAFTAATGKDHWEPLLRARAIENQVFVVAPNQRGSSNEKLHWHGRSMIVDPWGIVLAQAPDRDCWIAADLDLDAQARVRATLPSGDHRRPDVISRGST